MILATGNRAEPAPGRTGFTLIEIVLVLGLIALAAAAMISGFAAIVDRGDTLSTEETLFAAVRKARFIAASERKVTELRFEQKENHLQISIDNAEVETFPLDERFKEARALKSVFT